MIKNELTGIKEALIILAKEIDKINKTNYKPNNIFDEVQQALANAQEE